MGPRALAERPAPPSERLAEHAREASGEPVRGYPGAGVRGASGETIFVAEDGSSIVLVPYSPGAGEGAGEGEGPAPPAPPPQPERPRSRLERAREAGSAAVRRQLSRIGGVAAAVASSCRGLVGSALARAEGRGGPPAEPAPAPAPAPAGVGVEAVGEVIPWGRAGRGGETVFDLPSGGTIVLLPTTTLDAPAGDAGRAPARPAGAAGAESPRPVAAAEEAAVPEATGARAPRAARPAPASLVDDEVRLALRRQVALSASAAPGGAGGVREVGGAAAPARAMPPLPPATPSYGLPRYGIPSYGIQGVHPGWGRRPGAGPAGAAAAGGDDGGPSPGVSAPGAPDPSSVEGLDEIVSEIVSRASVEAGAGAVVA